MPHQPPRFDRAAIIGVGLLGSSLGLALRERGLANEVVGIGRRTSSLETALRHGAIHRHTLEIEAGIADADLIVIATPAGIVPKLLDTLRDCIGPLTIVTDVTSTKGAICAHARATWPSPRRFVGSHPMAGSERFGPEHGNARLYENSICLVEQSAAIDHDARAAIVALWEAVGARVVDIDPDQHDTLLARTSHLPHVLSAAIAILGGECGEVRELIGNGFRDMTRIAAGRPEIWRDICLTNRAAVLESCANLRQQLDRFMAALETEDGAALEAYFEAGRAARQKVVDP